MFKKDDVIVVRGKDSSGRVWNGNHMTFVRKHGVLDSFIVLEDKHGTRRGFPIEICKPLKSKEEQEYELVPVVVENLKVGDGVWVEGTDKGGHTHAGYKSSILRFHGAGQYVCKIRRDDGIVWWVDKEVLFIKKPKTSLRPINPDECSYGKEVVINGKFRCVTKREGEITRHYQNFSTTLVSQALLHQDGHYAAIYHKDEHLMVPLSCIFVEGVLNKPKVNLTAAEKGLEELRDMFSKVGETFTALEFDYGKIRERKVSISRNSKAVYALVDVKGKFYFGGTRACHYSLVQGQNIKDDVAYVVNMVCTDNAGYDELQPEQEKFLAWLYNNSPWKKAFITKDPKEAFKRGCVLTTEVPANYLLGALMAGRFVGEHNESLLSWNLLVNEGCDPCLAFVMSYGMFTSKGSTILKVNRGWESHGVFNLLEVDLKYLKNFMSDKQTNPLPNYSKHKSYNSVSQLYADKATTKTIYDLANQAAKPFLKIVEEKAGFASTKIEGLPKESIKDFLINFNNLVIQEF